MKRTATLGCRYATQEPQGNAPLGPANKGFLSLTLDEYLELLDWTGRQLHPGKRDAIPEAAPPILERPLANASSFIIG